MNGSVMCTIFLLAVTTLPAAGADLFASAIEQVPVFSTPDTGSRPDNPVRLDGCRQPRELEFIALPGTVFTIRERIGKSGEGMYRVDTAEYPLPSSRGYYVDETYLRLTETKPPERAKKLPEKEEVLQRLASAAGTPYLWGSNLREGVERFTRGGRPERMRGIDCSGLLYEATDGYTPRNTALLVTYGHAVSVSGVRLDDIVKKLRPLDLIVWRGHVLVVLNHDRIIESRLNCSNPANGGVVISDLRTRLGQIMKTRKPADKGAGPGTFVVRRWYPHPGDDKEVRLRH